MIDAPNVAALREAPREESHSREEHKIPWKKIKLARVRKATRRD
jgi:hypothetical protein